jgi:Transposase IS116/IS110/IS902 family
LRTRAIAAARVKTDAVDARTLAATNEIEQRAKADDSVDVLTQIRGVGRHTAMLIIAEVGEIERFPAARHLCAWAGLTPTVRSSDGKPRLGRITRQRSPALRSALAEAAQKCTTGRGPLRERFERISKRRGRKIANVTIARQILTLSHHRLHDAEIPCPAHHSRASTKPKLAVAASPLANTERPPTRSSPQAPHDTPLRATRPDRRLQHLHPPPAHRQRTGAQPPEHPNPNPDKARPFMDDKIGV